jgi:hypothetical protein
MNFNYGQPENLTGSALIAGIGRLTDSSVSMGRTMGAKFGLADAAPSLADTSPALNAPALKC